MTSPKTIGPFKPIEDIKADALLDLREDSPDMVWNAVAALRGSYGYTIKEARNIVGGWINEAIAVRRAAE